MTELHADFTALRTATDGRYDPVRLRFIESLLCRYEASRGKLAQVLEKKLRKALDDYRHGMPGARTSPEPAARAKTPLRELTELLNTLQGQEDDPDMAPLEQTLRQQELELVGAIARQAHQPPAANATLRQEELKAARRFHSAMVRLNADKAVTQALAEVPEDCGPLNPQRLATRSLETMRDLSPHYLSRFVSYIDTLFWLEQAEKSTS